MEKMTASYLLNNEQHDYDLMTDLGLMTFAGLHWFREEFLVVAHHRVESRGNVAHKRHTLRGASHRVRVKDQ